MNNYRLSRQAEQDLEDLWTYLAQKNEIASDIFLAKVLNKFPMLAQYPEMSQARKDLSADLRSFPVKPYMIFYRRTETEIEIIRVLHQSRDIESLF
jgi:toxin ParE1/3/4